MKVKLERLFWLKMIAWFLAYSWLLGGMDGDWTRFLSQTAIIFGLTLITFLAYLLFGEKLEGLFRDGPLDQEQEDIRRRSLAIGYHLTLSGMLAILIYSLVNKDVNKEDLIHFMILLMIMVAIVEVELESIYLKVTQRKSNHKVD
ncbi:hypothetical protein [Vaginisenegalia massiliensis]|uniref:hypothetical protein n=1 Tax=Vaginisenegalia massiliensis TaxID=2058294 RepID=UPI000F546AE3|nr:hypothetical protein [Vaginisenegalia massiliensis]